MLVLKPLILINSCSAPSSENWMIVLSSPFNGTYTLSATYICALYYRIGHSIFDKPSTCFSCKRCTSDASGEPDTYCQDVGRLTHRHDLIRDKLFSLAREFAGMGNVHGRKEVREEYMEYATHEGAHAPPQSINHTPTMTPYDMMQRPTNMKHMDSMSSEPGVQTMITWCYGGKQVAVQGSWDLWETMEFLQKTGDHFAIMKVITPGIYHYRFIVDGGGRYCPDLPHERDNVGNVFNVLHVKSCILPVLNDMSEFESPPSPDSSYNNLPFTIKDFNQKLPVLPPFLQQSLLNQPSSSDGSLEKPLPSVLNHLYIQKGRDIQSAVALSTGQRFRSKCVTLVLYKPVKQERK